MARENKESHLDPSKIKVHTTLFDESSLEIMFGLSLNKLSGIFGVSRNMMSLIHRHKRSQPGNSFPIIKELVRAAEDTSEVDMQNREMMINKNLEKEKIKYLERQIDDLNFSIKKNQRKLDDMIHHYHQLIAQITRSESIQYDNIVDEKRKNALFKTIDLSLFEKQLALKKVNRNCQFELQSKIVGQIAQLEHALLELSDVT